MHVRLSKTPLSFPSPDVKRFNDVNDNILRVSLNLQMMRVAEEGSPRNNLKEGVDLK